MAAAVLSKLSERLAEGARPHLFCLTAHPAFDLSTRQQGVPIGGIGEAFQNFRVRTKACHPEWNHDGAAAVPVCLFHKVADAGLGCGALGRPVFTQAES